MYSNNNYSGKYWAVFGSQLSGLTEERGYRVSDYRVSDYRGPDYRVPDYWGKTLFGKVDVWVIAWKAVFSNCSQFLTSLIKSIRIRILRNWWSCGRNICRDYFNTLRTGDADLRF